MSIILRKIIFTLSLLCCAAYSCAASPSKTVLWLNTQADFSVNKIIDNISPPDGLPGAVLAAKSRIAPDYYYHWVRDAALTMMAMNDVYRTTSNVETKNKIRLSFFDYLNFSTHIQNRVHDLGEPKFYVTGEVYEKPWGRPQNDGPALRAISLIQFADILIAEGQQSVVLKMLYSPAFPANSPIKKDLEYISHHWKDASYDLWEETQGTHFYTLMVIRRALLEGAMLAERLHDAGAAKWYRSQAKQIEFELQNFWDEKNGYITATINRTGGIDYKASNLDMSVILGLLHGGMDDGFLKWDHPHVTATIKHLTTTFAKLYPINQTHHIPGTAIGRYPEDRYDGDHFNGGNPWPMCTLALAEAFYNYAGLLKSRGDTSAAITISNRADQFVERVKYHAYTDGSLDEQIDRYTGQMTSARDLTWNYAALLTTRHAALQ